MNHKAIFFSNGILKDEITIGMAIDDHKLPDKEAWWAKSFKQLPKGLMAKYEFVKEDATCGPGVNTTFLSRTFKLKDEYK